MARAARFDSEIESFADVKTEAKQRGVRGETFANWYRPIQGYVFVARNNMPRGAKVKLICSTTTAKLWHLSK